METVLFLLSFIASAVIHVHMGLSATGFPGWGTGLAWMVAIGGGIGAMAGLLSIGRRPDGRPGITHSKVSSGCGWGIAIAYVIDLAQNAGDLRVSEVLSAALPLLAYAVGASALCALSAWVGGLLASPERPDRDPEGRIADTFVAVLIVSAPVAVIAWLIAAFVPSAGEIVDAIGLSATFVLSALLLAFYEHNPYQGWWAPRGLARMLAKRLAWAGALIGLYLACPALVGFRPHPLAFWFIAWFVQAAFDPAWPS